MKSRCLRCAAEDGVPLVSATWLVPSSVGICDVQKLMGHSSVAATRVYAHLAPGELHSVVDNISLSPKWVWRISIVSNNACLKACECDSADWHYDHAAVCLWSAWPSQEFTTTHEGVGHCHGVSSPSGQKDDAHLNVNPSYVLKRMLKDKVQNALAISLNSVSFFLHSSNRSSDVRHSARIGQIFCHP